MVEQVSTMVCKKKTCAGGTDCSRCMKIDLVTPRHKPRRSLLAIHVQQPLLPSINRNALLHQCVPHTPSHSDGSALRIRDRRNSIKDARDILWRLGACRAAYVEMLGWAKLCAHGITKDATFHYQYRYDHCRTISNSSYACHADSQQSLEPVCPSRIHSSLRALRLGGEET